MNWQSLLFQYWAHPRVIHRLPGRLRVHVPAMTKIPKEKRHLAESFKRFFLLAPGIQSVEISFTTNNLLFLYDQEQISEKEVLDWIRQLGKIVYQIWNRLSNVSEEELPQVTERIEKILKHSMKSRMVFDKEVTIPDDVWP